MTGKSGFAKIRISKGKTEIYMQIKSNESIIVQTSREINSGESYPYYSPLGEKVALKEPWRVNFIKGGPSLPASLTINDLKSWTEFGDEYAAFSGTAEYITRIPQLKQQAEAWKLELPEVYESAAVFLNGEYLGTLLNNPYCIEIPANLLKGNDELKIKVSNLMANRIADMDKKGIEWRIFYNTNFNARKAENTGKDGKFTAAFWEPKISGISGIVILTPLSSMK